MFCAGEYLVTIVKNTDIRGGGGGGNWGYVIINDQTLTPGATGGFVSTATAAAVNNNNNDSIRVDMSFNYNNNNKLIIGHETSTIPLSLLSPTPTPTPTSAPTKTTKSIILPNGDVLPLDIISGANSNDVVVVLW